MPNRPDEFLAFTPFTLVEINGFLSDFYRYYYDTLSKLKLKKENIVVSKQALIEICERIEKRRVYFKVFYNCKLSELNEACLICFWILKLSPFYSTVSPNIFVNQKIALCTFIRIVTGYAKKTKRKINLRPDLIKDLTYAFRFRDLSKEALMAIAESLIY
jgi:hypothetical protein